MRYSKTILLTGAGFTKNFGGFLGHEMWAKIFNTPQVSGSEKLTEILKHHSNFENAYHEAVTNPEVSEKERIDIREAIESAYKKLDDVLRPWVMNSSNPHSLDQQQLFGDFFSLFNGSSSEKGLIFTLNQDLLLERLKHHRGTGFTKFHEDFYSNSQIEFTSRFFVDLPSEKDVKKEIDEALKNHAGYSYIKLHGSYGWKSATGQNLMVVGKNKWQDIQLEPILREYFNIFTEAINQGSSKLVVIGYSFQDDHVNKLLAEAINNSGLKLFVITPTAWDKFKDNLTDDPLTIKLGEQILSGIKGYFPSRLVDFFPASQAPKPTAQYTELKNSILKS